MSCASSRRLHPPSRLRSRRCPPTICYQMWTVKRDHKWRIINTSHNPKGNYKLYNKRSLTIHLPVKTHLVKLNRCSSSKQAQPSQNHHRELPEVFGMERRANKEYGNWRRPTKYHSCYPHGSDVKQLYEIINVLWLPQSPYSKAESTNSLYKPHITVFGRAVNKKCLVNVARAVWKPAELL
jgi:hypothetical protein